MKAYGIFKFSRLTDDHDLSGDGSCRSPGYITGSVYNNVHFDHVTDRCNCFVNSNDNIGATSVSSRSNDLGCQSRNCTHVFFGTGGDFAINIRLGCLLSCQLHITVGCQGTISINDTGLEIVGFKVADRVGISINGFGSERLGTGQTDQVRRFRVVNAVEVGSDNG